MEEGRERMEEEEEEGRWSRTTWSGQATSNSVVVDLPSLGIQLINIKTGLCVFYMGLLRLEISYNMPLFTVALNSRVSP